MKTDLELCNDVLEELKWDRGVKAAGIGVAVKDGVVTLTGRVDSYAEKREAEHAAQRVAGVKAVAVEIEVKLPGRASTPTSRSRCLRTMPCAGMCSCPTTRFKSRWRMVGSP